MDVFVFQLFYHMRVRDYNEPDVLFYLIDTEIIVRFNFRILKKSVEGPLIFELSC